MLSNTPGFLNFNKFIKIKKISSLVALATLQALNGHKWVMAIVLDRRDRKCPFLFSESSIDQYYSRTMAIFHTLIWMVAT